MGLPFFPKGVFVTGTDTDVGKTLISCAMLHAWRAVGKTAIGMKPVAAGCEQTSHGLACGDVVDLMKASSVQAPVEWVNPYAFVPPIAPHLAAEEVGVIIELAHIRKAFMALTEYAEVVVVEGAGGFRAPLNMREDGADLARELGLPVVLVVGMKLGCLNHALLTADAIRSQGLILAGWVANRIDPEMLYFESNLDTLRQRLGAPLLGVVEFRVAPDPSKVAQCLLLPGLI